jgi:hypothetical protein
MASSWSALKIELIGTGEQSGSWGNTTNINLGDGGAGLEQAIVGRAELVTGDFTSNSYTLSYTDTNAVQDFRALVLDITATLSAAGTVIVPAINKPYLVFNNSVGGYDVTVKVSGQTGVTVPNGKKAIVYNNGTDVGHALSWIDSLTLGNALAVTSGGTGQTSFTNGQLLIGNTTGNTLSKATLTAGNNISVTNGTGSITLAATAAGSDTQIQFNDGGTNLGGDSGLVYNKTTNTLTVDVVDIGTGAGNIATNTAIGDQALDANTTGFENVAVGHRALTSNTTGDYCTAIGADALYSNTSANYNTAVGTDAAVLTSTGISNTAVGASALVYNVSGSFNTAFGTAALFDATGGANVAVGYYALSSIVNVTNNTAIGHQALKDDTGISNSSALGANTAVTGSNQVQLGDSSTTTYVYGTVQNRSDARDKADIRDTELGLDFIMSLRPVDYKWDYRETYKTAAPEKPIKGTPEAQQEYAAKMEQWRQQNNLSNITPNGSNKRSRYHHGLIAQEVKAVMNAKGIDFGGYQDHSVNGGDDVLSIGYDELIAPLIKAIQELKAEIEELKAR